MLKFYYSTQTCSTAVHIALAELGLPFEGVEVSWRRKLNLAELEAVNPLGAVPVLVDGGKTLTQTSAILEYLGDKTKKMIPTAGSWERALASEWFAFVGADFQKAFQPLVRASRWTNNADAQAEIKKAAYENIEKLLSHLDRSLAEREFILGKEFSLVDAHLFTICGWCKWGEVKIGKYSNLVRYLKRVYERPAVQKVLKAEEMLDFMPS